MGCRARAAGAYDDVTGVMQQGMGGLAGMMGGMGGMGGGMGNFDMGGPELEGSDPDDSDGEEVPELEQ